LSEAKVRGKMRIVLLGDAQRVVQSCRQMRVSAQQRQARRRKAGGRGAKVLHVRGLLRCTNGGNDGQIMSQGQRNSDATKELALEAGRLTANAKDHSIGFFPAHVGQEGND